MLISQCAILKDNGHLVLKMHLICPITEVLDKTFMEDKVPSINSKIKDLADAIMVLKTAGLAHSIIQITQEPIKISRPNLMEFKR